MATLREIMSTNLVTVALSASVAEAATVMGSTRVGSALVMDGERLVGIFTERDIVRALSQDFDAPTHPLRHWMTPDPLTVSPDLTVKDALDIMLNRGFRHLPVVEDERVVGMVSILSLIHI